MPGPYEQEGLQEFFKTLIKDYDKLPDNVRETLTKILGVSNETLTKTMSLLRNETLKIDLESHEIPSIVYDLVKLLTLRLGYITYIAIEYDVHGNIIIPRSLKMSLKPVEELEETSELIEELARINVIKAYLDSSYLLSTTRPKAYLWDFDLFNVHNILKTRENNILNTLSKKDLILNLERLRDVIERYRDKIRKIRIHLSCHITNYESLNSLREINNSKELLEECLKKKYRAYLKLSLPIKDIANILRRPSEASISEILMEYAKVLSIEVPEEVLNLIKIIEKNIKEGIDPLNHIENGYFRWVSELDINKQSYIRILERFRKGKKGLEREIVLLLLIFYQMFFYLVLYEMLRDPCQINGIFVNKFRNMLEVLNGIIEYVIEKKPEWYTELVENFEELSSLLSGETLRRFNDYINTLEDIIHVVMRLYNILKILNARFMKIALSPQLISMEYELDETFLKSLLCPTGLLLCYRKPRIYGEYNIGVLHMPKGKSVDDFKNELEKIYKEKYEISSDHIDLMTNIFKVQLRKTHEIRPF